jgi:hypothetical protein
MPKIDQADVVRTYKAFAAKLLRNPDDWEALIDQTALLLDNTDRKRSQYYVSLARRAYRNAPDEVITMFNLASALQRAGQVQEAAELYELCAARNDPKWHASIMHHTGIAARALGQNKKAIEYYAKAFELMPERLDIKKDLALALLADDQFSEGLQVFECRKEIAYEKLKWTSGELVQQEKLPPGVVHWKGEDLTGKSVVVYHEEGIGDFIHFCRFIPMLRERGATRIQLTGPVPDLLDLVADNVAVDGVVPMAGPYECDYVVGSMSVPWRCGATLERVSGKPYFQAQAATFPLRGMLNVGLVWRGNAAYAKDVDRSLPLSAFCPLLEIPDVAFYSLQMGAGAKEVTELGLDGFIADLAPFVKNWRATARLIRRLDAVVTVDTAVAHLAGALGVPVFILITQACDWRWDRNSTRTRWYDSAHVIQQQKHGDWEFCVNEARQILEELADERRPARGTDRQGAESLRAAE